MIEIDARLTPADVSAAARFVLVRRLPLWVLMIALAGFAALALAGGAPWYDAALVLGPLVAVLLWGVYVSPRRQLRPGRTAAAPHRWTVSDGGVRYVTFAEDGSELSEGSARWEALHRVAETRDAFLLFRAPRVCNPIPKRCFASAADIERFRALAADHGWLRS
jgi:hypothetical protein